MLFNSIMSQELGFFDSTLTGDITSRLVADTSVPSLLAVSGLHARADRRRVVAGVVVRAAPSWVTRSR